MASHHILQGDWANAALYLSSIKEFAGNSDEFHWNFGMVQVCRPSFFSSCFWLQTCMHICTDRRASANGTKPSGSC